MAESHTVNYIMVCWLLAEPYTVSNFINQTKYLMGIFVFCNRLASNKFGLICMKKPQAEIINKNTYFIIENYSITVKSSDINV